MSREGRELRLLKKQAYSGYYTSDETQTHKNEQHLGWSFLINYKGDHRFLDLFGAVHDVCCHDIGNW